MTKVEVPLPEGLLAALRRAPREMPDEIRVAVAIHWYQQGLISMERAAEAAGMTRSAFLAELARRKVDVFIVDEADLEDEPKLG